MQVGTDQLKRQQLLLTVKGFYKGKIDGIWGPDTVAAKKKWESDRSFVPGLPNSGLPFANKGPWPAGLRISAGLLTCAEVESYLVKKVDVHKVKDTTVTTPAQAAE